MNPQDENYPPDYPILKVDIQATQDSDGIWAIYCPQWRCEIHNRNLTRGVAGIVAEIEQHNEDCEMPEQSRKARLAERLLNAVAAEQHSLRSAQWNALRQGRPSPKRQIKASVTA